MALRLMQDGDEIGVLDSDLVANGDKDTSYRIRKLTTEKHREIVRRHTKPATRARDERVDQKSVQDDLLDYVLVDWDGVLMAGTDDAKAPCTREHKLRGLDMIRKLALIDRAGMTEIEAAEAARGESFRTA